MILDFLKKVLPEGLIVIAKPATKGFIHAVCNTFEEAQTKATQFDKSGKDCYFGLGSLIEPFKIRPVDGKKEVRVGPNIAQLKCLFLDLDVEAGSPKKYGTQVEAVTALRTFCKDESFPAPMLVNSGGGIHAYWPFDTAISAYDWRELAQTFKAALAEYGLKADPTRTADASSVLRVVGTHNYKHGMKRPVTLIKDVAPYPLHTITSAVKSLADKYKIAPVVVRAAVTDTGVLGDNLKKEYEPSDFNLVVSRCKQMADLVKTGGESEPLWYAGLQVARCTAEPYDAALAISRAYPGFDEAEMRAKLDNLEAKNIGATGCAQFGSANSAGCEGCPFKGKVTSPIQLGRASFQPDPPPVIVVNPVTGVATEVKDMVPPWPFVLGSKKQILLTNNAGAEPEVVCPFEIRPVRRICSERDNIDSVVWEVNLPLTGWKEFTLKQSILARAEVLHGSLYDISVIVGATQLKLMVPFMNAYIKQLQSETAIEQLFSRMGWRDDNTKFVLGDTIYDRSGTVTRHRLSEDIKGELPGLRACGDIEGWKSAIQFYNATGHEAHRFLLYCGFGAPLLHMTGHRGVIVNGSGDPGTGKTTVIGAAASIYGHPVDLLINGTTGGSTVNALYAKLAAYNNIPFGLDEITRIDPKILGDFALQVNQGIGKIRLLRSGTISQNTLSWATMVLTSANTDVYSTLSQSRADAGAEAMRVLQIPFVIPNSRTKNEADDFWRKLKENHGTAGHVYIQYITENYEAVFKRIIAATQTVDRLANISTAERFWSGAIAAAFVGALAARHLGLINNFPIEKDIEWIIKKLSVSRKSLSDEISSPRELFSEFMEARIGETLVVSQTTKANIAPRIDQMPRGSLSIRHEVDTGRVYVMKSEFKEFCKAQGANYGSVQQDLTDRKILVNPHKQVILGKGTDLAKGQVRCWEIDLNILQGE